MTNLPCLMRSWKLLGGGGAHVMDPVIPHKVSPGRVVAVLVLSSV